MIFKQFVVDENGEFHLEMSTRYGEGVTNCLHEADLFFREIGHGYFPVLEIESTDVLEKNTEHCLRVMFLLMQVEFFLAKGWTVRLVVLDTKKFFNFVAGNSDVKVVSASIMGSINCIRKSFRVSGFTAGCLYITFDDSFVYKDALSSI